MFAFICELKANFCLSAGNSKKAKNLKAPWSYFPKTKPIPFSPTFFKAHKTSLGEIHVLTFFLFSSLSPFTTRVIFDNSTPGHEWMTFEMREKVATNIKKSYKSHKLTFFKKNTSSHSKTLSKQISSPLTYTIIFNLHEKNCFCYPMMMLKSLYST